MNTVLNEVLRVRAQYFGLVPLESPVEAHAAAAEQNAAPTVTAWQ